MRFREAERRVDPMNLGGGFAAVPIVDFVGEDENGAGSFFLRLNARPSLPAEDGNVVERRFGAAVNPPKFVGRFGRKIAVVDAFFRFAA